MSAAGLARAASATTPQRGMSSAISGRGVEVRWLACSPGHLNTPTGTEASLLSPFPTSGLES